MRKVVFTLLLMLTMCLSSSVYAAPPLQKGVASYYHNNFHGRKTASGERFDNNQLTAAHRYYPFGTLLRVTNVSNQKSTVVRVNDRGPYSGGRVVDLSARAARNLGFYNSGLARVIVEIVR